jgi:hypothetical protein
MVDVEDQQLAARLGRPLGGYQRQRQAVASAGERQGQGLVGVPQEASVEDGADLDVRRDGLA